MVTTLSLVTSIPPSREVRITLPGDVPIGPAEIVVVIAPQSASAPRTLGDLLDSDFFGMWSNRDDITDSIEFARRLRPVAWSRPDDT